MDLTKNDKFDLEIVSKNFELSLVDEDDVLLQDYLNSYAELNKFFNLMGTIFGFVSSDLKSKMDILSELIAKEINHFKSVKNMIAYEKENQLLNKKGYTSGSRTLLRLHRGLDFIREFLRRVSELENSAYTAPACREAYDATLSKHHSFIIRKGAKVAMYALPTREQLLQKVCGSPEQVENAVQILPKTLKVTAEVYKRIEDLYTVNDLHSLP